MNMTTGRRAPRWLRAAKRASAASGHAVRAVYMYSGMADVATGVLHNVGNILNSVNVSAKVTMI